MIRIKDKLNDTNYNSEELKKFCKVEKTTEHDIFNIAKILCYNMGVNNPMFAIKQLIDSNVNVYESIKVYDTRDGEIYGVLILSHFNMDKGTPLPILDPISNEVFKKYSQINGFLFILDERLRGCGFDKKMIEIAMPFIESHDLIWVAVERDLKSHNYWKRMGMYEVMNIPQAIFYCKILNKNILLDIYKEICNSNETHNNRKRTESFIEKYDS